MYFSGDYSRLGQVPRRPFTGEPSGTAEEDFLQTKCHYCCQTNSAKAVKGRKKPEVANEQSKP